MAIEDIVLEITSINDSIRPNVLSQPILFPIFEKPHEMGAIWINLLSLPIRYTCSPSAWILELILRKLEGSISFKLRLFEIAKEESAIRIYESSNALSLTVLEVPLEERSIFKVHSSLSMRLSIQEVALICWLDASDEIYGCFRIFVYRDALAYAASKLHEIICSFSPFCEFHMIRYQWGIARWRSRQPRGFRDIRNSL